MNKPKGQNARLAALTLLKTVLDDGMNLADSDSESALPDKRDRAFARHLTYGVLRWKTSLDWLANRLLKRPLKERDKAIHRLILIGLFQLWKDGSAPHAAINETAGNARMLGKPWAVAVINAVLRRFQREQEQLLQELEKTDQRFAHPAWLLQLFKSDWPDDWPAIVTENNRAAPLWLRLNRNFTKPETTALLEQPGRLLESHPFADEAIKLSPPAAVNEIEGFFEGRFSVQDPAAQLAVQMLELADGQRILDACAAPGGKTCHILEQSPGVDLTILDRSSERLALVQQNLERLNLAVTGHVRLQAADAGDTETWWDGTHFDRILLDAPCTATGVIRRHPEIKWLRSPEQVELAVRQQATLLDRLWPLLQTGGILLYATCSVLKNENSRQIEQFIQSNPDAALIRIDAPWGKETGFGRQILPGEQEMDGFFYAALRKET